MVLNSDNRIHLSIVIPAYNEARRLPETLDAVSAYIDGLQYAAEMIVVDDGSSDNTFEIALGFAAKANRNIITIQRPHQGKAAAVQYGVLKARGDHILFTDADLSTPIQYADDLVRALDAGSDIAIGSREGQGARRTNEPVYRHWMGRVFNHIVQFVAVPGIEDTQCGFKAFRGTVAQDLFPQLHLRASQKPVRGPRVTAFDVELLFLAHKRGYTIVEIPVAWKHATGSKVNPLKDSLRMLGDVLSVRFNDIRGRYNLR